MPGFRRSKQLDYTLGDVGGWAPAGPGGSAWEEAKTLGERDYFFGNIEENRIQLGYAHGVLNPSQGGKPLVYFMYPYAEADRKPLGEDIGYNFGYKISFKE